MGAQAVAKDLVDGSELSSGEVASLLLVLDCEQRDCGIRNLVMGIAKRNRTWEQRLQTVRDVSVVSCVQKPCFEEGIVLQERAGMVSRLHSGHRSCCIVPLRDELSLDGGCGRLRDWAWQKEGRRKQRDAASGCEVCMSLHGGWPNSLPEGTGGRNRATAGVDTREGTWVSENCDECVLVAKVITRAICLSVRLFSC